MASSKKAKQKHSRGVNSRTIAIKAAGNRAGVLRFIIFVVVILLLCAGPFCRGLYFARELLVVHLVSFALFVFWWIVKLWRKEYRFPTAPLDICLFALGLFYFTSTLWAINSREAAGEFLKVINYLVIYLLVFDLCQHLKIEKILSFKEAEANYDQRINVPLTVQILLIVMVFSGAAVACGGLAAVSGADIEGAFVWGRLFSSLQYANAAAIYFLASMYLAVGLMTASKNRYLKIFYMSSAILLFISIILTYSRSVWLLIPPLVLLFAAIVGRGNRLLLLLYFAVIFSAGLPASFAAYHFFQEGASLTAWALIAASVIAALLLTALVELYLFRLSPAVKVVIAGAVLFAFCIAGFLWLQGELRSPLYLEQAEGQKAVEQYIEQVVSGVQGEKPYRLSLEVKAEGFSNKDVDEEYFTWKLAVLGIVADKFSNEYLTSDILEHRDSGIGEWQKREFAFKTPGNIRRLSIRLTSGYPGIKVTFRNVVLHGTGGDKPLRFYAHRILPAELYQRILLFRTDLAEEPRIAHYRDAWQIITDNPLWGYGGGAWNYLYPGYMTKHYWTSEPHNHYLKIWIEAGLFAFLAFMGICVASTISFLRFIKRKPGSTELRLARAAVYVAAISLLLHAAVDFSLSLGAVSLFLFTLLGVGRSLATWEEAKRPEFDRKKLLNQGVTIAGLIISLLLVGCTFSLWQGCRISEAAVLAYNKKNYPQAEALLYKAMKFDPQQALNYSLLADIYKSRAGVSTDRGEAVCLMTKALDLARQAWGKEPYNTTYNRKYGLILLNTGEVEAGLQRLKRNIELNPFNPDHYEQLAAALLAVAEYHLNADETKQAESFLRQVLELEVHMGRYHESTAELNYYLGRAHYLMQEWGNAIHYFLKLDEGNPHYGEAQQWIALLKDQHN